MFVIEQMTSWQWPNLKNMLNEFLTSNCEELISRCRKKVVNRFAPFEVPAAIQLGVPLLLAQIADMLRREQYTESSLAESSKPTPARNGIGRAATFLYVAELIGYCPPSSGRQKRPQRSRDEHEYSTPPFRGNGCRRQSRPASLPHDKHGDWRRLRVACRNTARS